jgi:hypothetical protein
MQGWTSLQVAHTVTIGATPMHLVALKWTPLQAHTLFKRQKATWLHTDYLEQL